MATAFGVLATMNATVTDEQGNPSLVNIGVYNGALGLAGMVIVGEAISQETGAVCRATSVDFPDLNTALIVFIGQTKGGRPVNGTATVVGTDRARHLGKVTIFAALGEQIISLTDAPCNAFVSAPAGTPTPQPVVP